MFTRASPITRASLAPYAVEVASDEWARLARSDWVKHALAQRWTCLIREDGRLRLILARASLEMFAAAGGRLWRYSDVEVQLIRTLQAIIQRLAGEERR